MRQNKFVASLGMPARMYRRTKVMMVCDEIGTLRALISSSSWWASGKLCNFPAKSIMAVNKSDVIQSEVPLPLAMGSGFMPTSNSWNPASTSHVLIIYDANASAEYLCELFKSKFTVMKVFLS